jgi:choline dehydrogenase-like flavoprotein
MSLAGVVNSRFVGLDERTLFDLPTGSLKKACDKVNVLCVPARMAIITQPLNGRPACHYCGQCSRGCKSASNFSSSQVLIPPALATGRLRVITNAMAREIVVGKDGKAEAVAYIDRTTKEEKQVYARSFVVAASTCESARLLLNSRSTLFPQGLANSSGVVGRNLMDSVGSWGSGYFPQLEKMPPHNHDGSGGNYLPHVYMPWWKFDRKNEFLRGYHIELSVHSQEQGTTICNRVRLGTRPGLGWLTSDGQTRS